MEIVSGLLAQEHTIQIECINVSFTMHRFQNMTMPPPLLFKTVSSLSYCPFHRMQCACVSILQLPLARSCRSTLFVPLVPPLVPPIPGYQEGDGQLLPFLFSSPFPSFFSIPSIFPILFLLKIVGRENNLFLEVHTREISNSTSSSSLCCSVCRCI